MYSELGGELSCCIYLNIKWINSNKNSNSCKNVITNNVGEREIKGRSGKSGKSGKIKGKVRKIRDIWKFWENVRESDEIRGKSGGLGKGMEIRGLQGKGKRTTGKIRKWKGCSNFLCFRVIELRNLLFNYLLDFLRETWKTHSFIVPV